MEWLEGGIGKPGVLLLPGLQREYRDPRLQALSWGG